MKNFQNQILKQEILSEKMSEQNSEIEYFQDKLFGFYVFWQKLDQYTLEVHFVFKYNNFWNDNPNKCDICNNCFENNINLSLRHMKTVHEGDKDFKFESLCKSFTQADSSRGHIIMFPKVTNIPIDIIS